ncbi:biotin--[acetyl-CoA-carboxylase] ligase [Acidicapsa ligni]|uniref:biotin--[acetyl-CoA-carboxylase] ligase n=1 Tax=Acidicapsa ligni TaxID=542300 RepID=UPI0021E05E9F|nr:biotin--[acetyl-CoA-carboxylase] ligase [Acidicapsa ligni]
MPTDQLNPNTINTALVGTPFSGKMHHLATIESTNTHALAQIKQAAPHGSFYIADEQTAGRGRSDHQWHSALSQGLYLSVLLRPAITAPELVWIPLLAGLAAHSAITEATGLTADLRWPNDLLIGPRKTGGILVEAQTDSGKVTGVVIGIGINLHQQQFPLSLAGQAFSTEPTSLDLETGRITSRQQLLIAILQSLDTELKIFHSQNRHTALSQIPSRIEAISTWVNNRRVEVHGPQPCTGITAGLDPQGFLKVRTATGLITITTGGIRAAAN